MKTERWYGDWHKVYHNSLDYYDCESRLLRQKQKNWINPSACLSVPEVIVIVMDKQGNAHEDSVNNIIFMPNLQSRQTNTEFIQQIWVSSPTNVYTWYTLRSSLKSQLQTGSFYFTSWLISRLSWSALFLIVPLLWWLVLRRSSDLLSWTGYAWYFFSRTQSALSLFAPQPQLCACIAWESSLMPLGPHHLRCMRSFFPSHQSFFSLSHNSLEINLNKSNEGNFKFSTNEGTDPKLDSGPLGNLCISFFLSRSLVVYHTHLSYNNPDNLTQGWCQPLLCNLNWTNICE